MSRLLLLALVACAPTESLDPLLEGDALQPPPPTDRFELLLGFYRPGGSADVIAVGLPPQTPVSLYRSKGVEGQGPCPPLLQGDCLDITPGVTGYELVTQGTTSARGSWFTAYDAPVGVLDETRHAYQAVAFTNPPMLSRPHTRQAYANRCLPTMVETPSAPYPTLPRGSYTLDICRAFTVEFVVPAGRYGTVDWALMPPISGEVSARLYQPSGPQSYQDRTYGDSAILAGDPVVDTVWRLEFGPNFQPGIDGSPLALDLDLAPLPTTCPPDAREDDDTLFDAVAAQAGVPITGTACAGDPDWLAFDVPPGVTLDVQLTVEGADVDLFLVDANASEVDRSETQGIGAAESVRGGSSIGGTYLARIEPIAELLPDGGTYTVVATEERACILDSLEPNDTPSEATLLPVPSLWTDLGSCRLNPASQLDQGDWYALDLLAGDSIVVDLLFEQADGDLDLSVYDPGDSFVVGSGSTTDDEQVVFTAGRDGVYTVFVDRVRDGDDRTRQGVRYDLEVSASP